MSDSSPLVRLSHSHTVTRRLRLHLTRGRPFTRRRPRGKRADRPCVRWCVSRALLRGGRGKEEPLSVLAMVLQAAPGGDDLPLPAPLGTPPVRCLTFDDSNP